MSVPQGLTFVDPAAVVKQLSVKPGDKIADFGSGAGYFSFEFAKQVGSDGIVYALDVLPAALEAVVSRAKILGLTNIVTRRVNLERENGSTLGNESIDWVVLKDMLFQNQKKNIILREVMRVLKPGGRTLIMEWSVEGSLVGPEKELRISHEQMKILLEEAGFMLEREINVGGFHYAFVVKENDK